MTPTEQANELIQGLLLDPAEFERNGRAYELLQTYFQGATLETLRPLLRSDRPLVAQAAIYIASELGSQAASLLDDVVPILRYEDPWLRHFALECVAVCATAGRAGLYANVLLALEDPDERIREDAMFLMSNADGRKLEQVLAVLSTEDERLRRHRHWLQVVLSPGVGMDAVLSLIHSPEALARRYGAIAAARLYERFPGLVAEAVAERDSDIKSFLEHKGLREL
jgi:hypothetical protein